MTLSNCKYNYLLIKIIVYNSITGIKQKIDSDVSFDGKKAALSQFDSKEQTIIEAGSLVRGGRFDVWGPERGILK